MELYLQPKGKIAFLMPYAALNRKQFEGFRKGWFGGSSTGTGKVYATVRFIDAWTFDERVQPLFPVPSCALFALRDATAPPPKKVLAFSGRLPKRDASKAEAETFLTSRESLWPSSAEHTGGSAYRTRFRNGATMYPRMLCLVDRVDPGRFGGNPDAPLVKSRRSAQEKAPWKGLPQLRRTVEAQFLRQLYLGESIAPFRLLESVEAVIPWDEEDKKLLDAITAEAGGHVHVADWLRATERLWRKHGHGRITLVEQLDHYGKLSAQFPVAKIRVLYSKAGTLPAAAVLRDDNAVVDHKLYWGRCDTGAEADYLTAILNAEAVNEAIKPFQSMGLMGERDIHKKVLELPIPRYNSSSERHVMLSNLGSEARKRANKLITSKEFPRSLAARRSWIRGQLQDLLEEIDKLVKALL